MGFLLLFFYVNGNESSLTRLSFFNYGNFGKIFIKFCRDFCKSKLQL